MTFQFKIQIKGIVKPPVWRRVCVPSAFTFERFHEVIQVAFGWKNEHLFLFTPKGSTSQPVISIPSEDDWEMGEDARIIKLGEIFFKKGQKYTYIYDFGDNWEHEITLEAITDKKSFLAVGIDGKGACPPEDCGGRWAYENMKRMLKEEPDSEESLELLEWLGLEKGMSWEKEYVFSIEKVNLELRSV